MLHRTGGLTRVALSLTTAASPPASPTFSREPPAGTSTGYDEECWAAVHLSCDRQHARPMLSMLEYDKACIFYGKKGLQNLSFSTLYFFLPSLYFQNNLFSKSFLTTCVSEPYLHTKFGIKEKDRQDKCPHSKMHMIS